MNGLPACVCSRMPHIPDGRTVLTRPEAHNGCNGPVGGSGGIWRLQLGAFSVPGNAEKLWASLSKRPEMTGSKRQLVPAGKLTKLYAAGFASKAQADRACGALKASGHECIVTS